MDLSTSLPTLLGLAWLAPLVSFVAILFFGPRIERHGEHAAWVATAAIVTSLGLSLVAAGQWFAAHPVTAVERGEHGDGHGEAAGRVTAGEHDKPGGHDAHEPVTALTGDWYTLYEGGDLRLTIGWYIDALTILMFVVVTFSPPPASTSMRLATCTTNCTMSPTTRCTFPPGATSIARAVSRVFQALSLFCFSMLGIVIAGNLAMVFIFWELVGICSWFLIGFYYERKSASTAANKAFIVNRVGDFGMLIGLMALWGGLGTLHFGDVATAGADGQAVVRPGMFSLVRPAAEGHVQRVPDGLVKFAAAEQVARIAADHADRPAAGASEIASQMNDWRTMGLGRWLLFVAGVGIFCGCVGKSAQVPLFVWLPDAMEGPTPVSAARPLGDDGRGGRVLGRPVLSGAHAGRAPRDRLRRRDHALHRGHHRTRGQ